MTEVLLVFKNLCHGSVFSKIYIKLTNHKSRDTKIKFSIIFLKVGVLNQEDRARMFHVQPCFSVVSAINSATLGVEVVSLTRPTFQLKKMKSWKRL